MDDIVFYNMDCLEGLAQLESESVDLLATDPPYGIAFMGKDWDKFNEVVEPQGAYQYKKGFKKLPRQKTEGMMEFFTPIWKDCLRVLKPGGFAFVMCIPRADCMSRMIISLEDAGFDVGFTPIYHAFASGFPKAQNISVAIDKQECRRQLTEKLGREPTKVEFDEAWKEFREVTGVKITPSGQEYPRGYEVRDTPVPFERSNGLETKPATSQAKALDGSYAGFSPKPAVEVVIVAMKPMSAKSYVEQALKNRKGITWLGDARIPYESETDKENHHYNAKGMDRLAKDYGEKLGTSFEGGWEKKTPELSNQGRFPANLLVSDDVLNTGVDSKGSHDQVFLTDKESIFGCSGSQVGDNKGYGDTGSFSRYFSLDAWWEEKLIELPQSVQKTFPFLIVPKASKSEKNKGVSKKAEKDIGHNRFDKCAVCGGYILQNPDRPSACKCENPVREHNKVRGNIHPTVKPVKLFSYLVTLGSRKGDMVLDPFGGTMTTAVACAMLSRKFVGFETDKESCEIAQERLGAGWQVRMV